MRVRRIFIYLLVSLFLSFSTYSQTNNFYLVSEDILPKKYQSGIKKARVSIEKGMEFLEKAEEAQERLQNYRDIESIKPLKLLAMKEKIYRHQLKASSFFYDGHRLEYRILKRYLKKEYPIQYERVHDEAGKQFYRGSVLRKRGADAVPNTSPLVFIHEAVGYEKRALKDLEMVYKFDKEYLTSLSVPVFLVDSVFPKVVNLKSLVEKYAEMKPEPPQAVQGGIVSKKQPGVFFSIQFLATREPVTERRARGVYDGLLPVMRSSGDGWHRFSAGRFESVAAATKMMKKERIHGFVIAFKGDKRISIKKAEQLINP